MVPSLGVMVMVGRRMVLSLVVRISKAMKVWVNCHAADGLDGEGDEGPGHDDGEAHANAANNSWEKLGGVEVEDCVRAVRREPGIFKLKFSSFKFRRSSWQNNCVAPNIFLHQNNFAPTFR